MILITGAAGKTGIAVLKALLRRDIAVRVYVRNNEQAEALKEIGAADAVIGDMTDAESMKKAMIGADAVYHICPNMHPGEIEIGRLAIAAAIESGLGLFVYHSVLHPQVEKMPHHWLKMRVEELLFESGLEFTILQPAPYMQNLMANRDSVLIEKVYRIPYPQGTRLSLVDLEDLGEAAAVVLTEPGHKGAIYEIVGTRALSQVVIADLIGNTLGLDLSVEEMLLEDWRKNAEKNGLSQYQIKTLLRMFDYYARFGLSGNNYLLGKLIGKDPRSLTAFIRREFI